jgi:hypothetical protein
MAAHADAEPRSASGCGCRPRRRRSARARRARPGVEVAQRDRRAVVVLLDGDRLGAVADRRAERERALADDRLERVLVDEDADGRAEALDALVELVDVGGELASGERLDRDDAARRAVGLERLRAHPLLEPHLADHLHRAQLEVPARGWIAVPAWRSTDSDGTPWWPSSMAVVSPTRLPPTIRTGSPRQHDATLDALRPCAN